MSLPESITRKLWIDQALAHAGWSPTMAFDPHAPCARAALAEYPTMNGPADYVLFDAGQPLTVVKAKRPPVAPQNVLTQAQRYARGFRRHASWEPTFLAGVSLGAASCPGPHQGPVSADGRCRDGGGARTGAGGAVRAVGARAGVSGGSYGNS